MMNLAKDIDTNMNFDFMFKMILAFSSIQKSDLSHKTLPGEGEYIYNFERKKKINYYIVEKKDLEASKAWFLGDNKI